MQVAKLHATGNDFLVTHEDPGAPDAAALCDRHRGVGADGLIVLTPGQDGAHATMLLRNADGGVAEMSGNGARCLAWVAVRDGFDGDLFVVDTGGGRREIALDRRADGGLVRASVDMGAITFEPAEIPLDAKSPFGLTAEYHGTTYEGDAAGIGNPHFVLFVDDPARARVTQHGPHLEVDERFPNRTNVEFVAFDGPDSLRMRVWERGVGETLSCGTGACAAAAVANRRGLVGEKVIVRVPGGELQVTLGATVQLGGPVVHLFDLEIDPGVIERSTS